MTHQNELLKKLQLSNGYKVRQVVSYQEIYNILYKFNNVFEPALFINSLEITDYAYKLFNNSCVFVAEDSEIVGFISFYANDVINKVAYINQLAIEQAYQNKGIGNILMKYSLTMSKEFGMTKAKLEVAKKNKKAINFYLRNGFIINDVTSDKSYYMTRIL